VGCAAVAGGRRWSAPIQLEFWRSNSPSDATTPLKARGGGPRADLQAGGANHNTIADEGY